MSDPLARFIDGMKFMWDGKEYRNNEEAGKTQAEYEKRKFTTRIVEENGKILLFTRRVVTEVVVEGNQPV
jgi:hypothetical protein